MSTAIVSADSSERVAAAAQLFVEYAASLGVDLSFQDFDRELAGLPGAYAPPRGCLLLAVHGEPIGCVAVRPIDPNTCEMKRLYVRPVARGSGAGRRLAEAAIAFARDAGYAAIRLDTLPSMRSAQGLYRTLGFVEIPPYRFNPVEGTSYFELRLDQTVTPAMDDTRAVNEQYGGGDVGSRILAVLRDAGKELHALTREDLAPFDEFHSGGRESTRELARLAGLTPGLQLLDLGSGVGGPARTLAGDFGCDVTGLDLTAEFCRAAEMLTARVGMSDRVRFRQGNALAMPFADASFDVAWSQNAIMNIEDKAALAREIARVLRPGGLFAFEAVLAGPVGSPHYPVFWADTPGISHLVSPTLLNDLLTGAGLRARVWEDRTERSRATGRQRREAARAGLQGQAIGFGALVPRGFKEKVENSLRNYEEGRTIGVQGVYVKA